MLCINKTVLAFSIPILLSAATVLTKSFLLFAVLFISHFIIIRILPSARGHENVWMFLLVFTTSVPVNVYLLLWARDWLFYDGSFLFYDILKGILYYIMLVSVEESIMGVITRFIWKKQYKIRF